MQIMLAISVSVKYQHLSTDYDPFNYIFRNRVTVCMGGKKKVSFKDLKILRLFVWDFFFSSQGKNLCKFLNVSDPLLSRATALRTHRIQSHGARCGTEMYLCLL